MKASELDRKFGVVVFDDDQDPGAGWACVANGVARRISGPNELATDTIWWTNISYEMFFRRTEIWRQPNLRHDKYLVVGPTDVLREWGFDPATHDADFVCTVCAKAFDRIMRLAWRLLSDVNPKMRIEEAFTGKTLREDVRQLLPKLEYPKGEAATVMKSGQAWEEFTATGARWPKGSKWVTLRRPRLSYALEILQTLVPRGPFNYKTRADLRSQSTDRVQYVKDSTQPCMVEVSVHSISPEVAPIYGFGSATDKERRVQRSWVAHPEFILLSRFASVDVRSIWEGHEYYGLVPELAEPVKDFLSDKFTEYSWSAGIIAETLWRSVVLGEDKTRGGPLREGEERAQTSWQGAWLRAADKTVMFSVALRLAELGYSVLSYGLGWVRCAVPEEETIQYIKDGLTFGLIPQLLDVPEGAFNANRIPAWEGDDRSKAFASLTLSRNSNMLWNLDHILLMPRDKRNEFVRHLKQQAKTA